MLPPTHLRIIVRGDNQSLMPRSVSNRIVSKRSLIGPSRDNSRGRLPFMLLGSPGSFFAVCHMTLLKDLIEIPERIYRDEFVLKLSEGVNDPAKTLSEYVSRRSSRLASTPRWR